MPTLTWSAAGPERGGGSNPAPGQPEAYEGLARAFETTADHAGEARATLTAFTTSVGSDVWRGQAADAFRDGIDELPPKLVKLADSYARASGAMAAYARTLGELQARAEAVLSRAQAAAAEEEASLQRRDQAQALDPVGPTIGYDDAIADAARRRGSAEAELEDIRAERVAAESRAIAGLDEAGDMGIANDGWLKRAWGSVDRWIDDHAGILRGVSSILKAVSAVAGLLSFIPFLTPFMAPLAFATAGLTLGLDAVLVATGNGSWKALAVDAALMALPVAGKLASNAIRARRASKVADVADDVPVVPTRSAKPPFDAPEAADWRYRRYVEKAQARGSKEPLGFDEWKTRHFDPAAAGGRPGRVGGPQQVSAKEVLEREGIRRVENVRLGNRYPDGVATAPNPAGGTDYYEVGTMLKKGMPEARERVKLADEINVLGRDDTVSFVDKVDPANRIRYGPGDDVSSKALTGSTGGAP